MRSAIGARSARTACCRWRSCSLFRTGARDAPRRAEGYYIVHVESGKTEGHPLVNGMAIGAQARKLQDNDVIQLAGVKMGFFLT